MILKDVDALKLYSRTDPDCAAHRDLRVIFPAACDGVVHYTVSFGEILNTSI